MDLKKAVVIPLHNDWKYLNVCCDLINEEWPRSRTARMHSLEASCDNLPTSLILVLIEGNGENLVVGHSKISPIHRIPNACFIESVVIARKFRGKGWGRFIMQETEEYVKNKGKSVIYLSTSDKEKFYRKLGYAKCEPVSIYGGSNFKIRNIFTSPLLPLKQKPNFVHNGALNTPSKSPPPFPKSKFHSYSTKTYMQKVLM